MKALPLTGPASAVLLLAGLFEGNIETQADDSAISSWLRSHGDGSWMVHATLEVLGAMLLVVFVQTMVSRLGPDDALRRTASAFGTLVATLVVVGAGLFAAVPVGRFFESAPQPDPSTYRYLMAAAASVFVIFLSLPAAGLCAALSLQGLRHRTMPTWLARTGIGMAVLMLLSAFVAPLMVFGLWLVVTGCALAFARPRAVQQETPTVAVPA